MTDSPIGLDELIQYVNTRHPDGGALERLAEAWTLSENLGSLSDHLIGHFVDQARRAGASWTEIGQSLGVSKQAAQKRFVPRSSDEPENLAGGPWARFTERARNVVVQAQREAGRAGHAYVGTEHLVLGLLHEPESLAIKAMTAQGVTPEAVKEAIEAILPPAAEPLAGHIPFSGPAKKVRDLTVREALRLGHNYVGTEHILLGLLDDEQGSGGAVLRELGVAKDEAERWILAALKDIVQRRQPGA